MRSPSPKVFLRLAMALCALWLLAVYPLLNWFCWKKMPASMHSIPGDFEQYYSGAIAARHGLWAHLYPIPKPETEKALMQPIFRDLTTGRREARDLAQFNSFEASSASAELLAFCPSLEKHYRYIYPPPLALYLEPLAFFDCETSRKIWFEVMCAALFGTAFVAAKLTRMLWGEVTYTEGWIFVLLLIWTALGNAPSTALSAGNVSPLLAFLIAGITHAWIQRREVPVAVGLIALLPFKGIGIFWCPLLLLKPVQKKALFIMATLTLLINGVTLHRAGLEVYRHFFSVVLPQMNRPAGIGIQGTLWELFGLRVQPLCWLLNGLGLAALYYGFWRTVSTATNLRQRTLSVMATFAGTLALFCLLNPVVWLHYWIQYVLLPFFGWLIWEARQASGSWQRTIHGMLALNGVVFLGFFVSDNHWIFQWLLARGASIFPISLPLQFMADFVEKDLLLIEASFALALAFRRLLAKQTSLTSESLSSGSMSATVIE